MTEPRGQGTSSRVSGHALRHEGAPYDELGNLIRRGWYYTSTDGPGRALCECGTLSPEFSSRRRRRIWHRAHKQAILSQDPTLFDVMTVPPCNCMCHLIPGVMHVRACCDGDVALATKPVTS